MKRKKPSREGKSGETAAAAEMKILQQAAAHHQAGRLGEAEALYTQVLAAQPENPDALHLLGVCAYQSGRLDEAEETIRRAIVLNPGAESYYGNLGLVLKDRGKLDDAEAMLRKALELNPKGFGALNNLGLVLQAQGRLDEAVESLRRATEANPENAKARVYLGLALLDCHKPAEAKTIFRHALELDPDNAATRNNLGNALLASGEVETARDSFLAAITLKPDFAAAHNNLGNAFKALGDPKKAISAYEKAVKIDPGNAELRHNLGLVLLLTGRLKEGWAEHEWRWRHKDAAYRPYPQPPLADYLGDGSPLAGKRLLVWSEQGVGDELQFAVMIPELMDQGATVILESDPRLTPLFARSFPKVTCMGKSDPPDPSLLSGDIDYQIPLGGLARFLRPDLESFPKHKGYLKADPDQTRELRERYGGGESFLVGISWNSTDKTRPEKSIPLLEWRPLLETPGVTFVNLQYGDTAEERATALEDLGIELVHDIEIDPLTDLDGFASQVAAMDVTISICNSTIHMAGALGHEAWALVPFAPDWRWFLDREDSPWYPGVRLYRQETRGDWEGVMGRIARDLARKVGAS